MTWKQSMITKKTEEDLPQMQVKTYSKIAADMGNDRVLKPLCAPIPELHFDIFIYRWWRT